MDESTVAEEPGDGDESFQLVHGDFSGNFKAVLSIGGQEGWTGFGVLIRLAFK